MRKDTKSVFFKKEGWGIEIAKSLARREKRGNWGTGAKKILEKRDDKSLSSGGSRGKRGHGEKTTRGFLHGGW